MGPGPGLETNTADFDYPDVGSSRKLMQRRRVLLPDPERPKMTTTSPRVTSRSTPFRTSLSPNDLRSSAHLDHRLGHAGSLSTNSTPGWVVTLIVVRT